MGQGPWLPADGRRTIPGDGGWAVRLAVVPVRLDDRRLAAGPRDGSALHRRSVDRSGVAGASALGARGRRRAVVEHRTGLPRWRGALAARWSHPGMGLPRRARCRIAADHARRAGQPRPGQLLHRLVHLGRPLRLLLLRARGGVRARDAGDGALCGHAHRPPGAVGARALADDRRDAGRRRRLHRRAGHTRAQPGATG